MIEFLDDAIELVVDIAQYVHKKQKAKKEPSPEMKVAEPANGKEGAADAASD